MSTATRRRRPSRSFANAATTVLRFSDGLIVNTRDCPDGIPARNHWVAPGACLHTAHSSQIAAAAEKATSDTLRFRLADAASARHTEEQQAGQAHAASVTHRCPTCGAKSVKWWCDEACREADEGPVEE